MRFFKIKNPKPAEIKAEHKNEFFVANHDFISLSSIILIDHKQANFFVGDSITIEQNATVIGNVSASTIIVKGVVKGNILSVGNLTIKPSSVIEGNVITQTIIINTGAVLNGNSSIVKEVSKTNLTNKILYAENLSNNNLQPVIEIVEIPNPL